MNKKDLTERDICSKFISPAVKRAGWDGMMQIREEVPIPDIERLGYTPTEAGFLALVAGHSGFFLRRHFNRYMHKEDGGLAHAFLTKALKKKHVQLLPSSAPLCFSSLLPHPLPPVRNQRVSRPADQE